MNEMLLCMSLGAHEYMTHEVKFYLNINKENHALFLQIYSVSSDMKEMACLYGLKYIYLYIIYIYFIYIYIYL